MILKYLKEVVFDKKINGTVPSVDSDERKELSSARQSELLDIAANNFEKERE